ncbi:MAG: DUF4282 domain-containing protein [Propionibacteriaceae bacterium]|nr:DUF4282 domain-containing protein [Propionibacteriaceae bacterium]
MTQPENPQQPYGGYQPPAGDWQNQGGYQQQPVGGFQQPAGGYQQQPGYPPAGPPNEYAQALKVDPGFMKTLFSPNFSYFVTPKIVSALYVVLMVVLGLSWLIMVIASFINNAAVGFGALILGAVYVFLMLILVRISLEFYVAAIRTAENTTKLVEKAEGN